jgi:hypothetical protein
MRFRQGVEGLTHLDLSVRELGLTEGSRKHQGLAHTYTPLVVDPIRVIKHL